MKSDYHHHSMTPIKYINLDFTELFVFEHFVISQLKEDTLLEPANSQILIDLILDYYQERPFVYIANRYYSYNVNPMTNLQASNLETLAGICIVTLEGRPQEMARFEGSFYKNDFHVCDRMEDAIAWAMKVIDKKIGI